jgi:hypothetical protein
VVLHAGRLRREDHEVAAALAQDAQLVALDALPELVVADRRERRRDLPRELGVPELLQLRGRRRVVPVAVDDHRSGSCST